MTHSSMFLLCLVGQVTLLSCLIAVIYLTVRRGQPRTAVTVLLTGLLMTFVLTVLTTSPWPRWFAEGSAAGERQDSLADMEIGEFPAIDVGSAGASTGQPSVPAADAPGGGELSLWMRVLSWWDSVTSHRHVLGKALSRWSGVIASLVIVAAIVGMIRLAAGWVMLRKCLRCSTVVGDRDMGALLEQLRAKLSCRRDVELRECRLLSSAATVGWRSPVVLLPANWRDWSRGERKTVFAHELAHVVSGDAAAWLWAQIVLMLHFYHPLVHWLIHQLRIEQELAADAVAARMAGGPQTYLETLAGLAVRQPDRPVAWPARPFLPERGTLLRRIEMLRDSRHQPEHASTFRRNLVIAAGIVAACLVAGLRPPTSATEAAEQQQAAETQQTQAPTVRNVVGLQDDRKSAPVPDEAMLARRASMTNAKRIALALHIYYSKNDTFPPPVLLGPDGKTQHSWRVAVLPYLDEEELYNEYDLSQPWDSAQNKKVLEKMPAVFRSPHAEKDSTNAAYFALTGDQTGLGNQPGQGHDVLRLATDGTSNTILIVEAKRDIPWTKPEDIPYSSDKDVPKLGGFDEQGFVTAFADGAAHFLPAGLSEGVLRSLITHNGGEPIDWKEINRRREP